MREQPGILSVIYGLIVGVIGLATLPIALLAILVYCLRVISGG